jgi:membrane-bound lytic murein transglycosylase D
VPDTGIQAVAALARPWIAANPAWTFFLLESSFSLLYSGPTKCQDKKSLSLMLIEPQNHRSKRLRAAVLLGLALSVAGCTSSEIMKIGDASNDIAGGQKDRLRDAAQEKIIWRRVQQHFGLPDVDNTRVSEQREFFLKYRSHFRKTQEQAQPYLHFILTELEKRNMPSELAFLPIIESGYRPRALSPGKALGIWQIIPGTGKVFGLESSKWYDGRRDVIASTLAALNYLDRLSNRYDKDWMLTLAAYNAGEGTVDRAIKKNAAKGRATDYWSLDLPAETQKYVPKLLAIKQLVKHPERYGIELEPIKDEQQVSIVKIDSPIDLNVVARLADTSMELLRKLNPGFSSWFTSPHRPHRLLLPSSQVQVFEERLAALPEHKRIQLKSHKVAKGETLKKLAQRYKTDPELIKLTNKLTSDTLKPASIILIPTPYEDKIADQELLLAEKKPAT